MHQYAQTIVKYASMCAIHFILKKKILIINVHY